MRAATLASNPLHDLKTRTKRFALEVILDTQTLPHGEEFIIVRRQLIRSATSTAANYRSAHRAKSKPHFSNELGIAEEAADESLSWLECLDELVPDGNAELKRLLAEADKLVAILTASRKSTRD